MHRAVAAALDASMILIGFGIFLLVFHLSGGEFVWNRETVPMFGTALAVIGIFYGMLWILAGRETAGMRWTDLRLTNFDGFPPDRTQRVIRFAGTCLSFGAIGAGLVWALVDEETLTWQDHMSKTFPTLKETDTNFYRKR